MKCYNDDSNGYGDGDDDDDDDVTHQHHLLHNTNISITN